MNKEEALALVTRDGIELRNLPQFQNDLDVVMTALENSDGGIAGGLQIYLYVSLRCKMDIEVIDYIYTKFGPRFLVNLPVKAWSNPNVLDWASRIPENEIPVPYVDKVTTLKNMRKTERNKLPNALLCHISSFVKGGTTDL
jgi:hypothetical protein